MSRYDKLNELIRTERAVAAQTSTARRRVQIEEGQQWLVRFLPVEFGPSKLFFARQAQHWMDKKPINCPKFTSTDFGGNPEAHCPVCDKADELLINTNTEVSDFGFKLKVGLSYNTVVLCYGKDDGKHGYEDEPNDEFLNPYEFALRKGPFDKLCTFVSRSITAQNPGGCLDLLKGKNFLATMTKKGIDLLPEDPTPIFEHNEHFDEHIAKIWSKIRPPSIKLPTEEELVAYARKAEARAYGDEAGPGDTGRRGRSIGRPPSRRFSEDDAPGGDVEEAPTRVPVRATAPAPVAPARRPAPIAQEQAPDEAPPEYSEPAEEPPAPPRPAPVAARTAPVRQSAPPPAAQPRTAAPAARAAVPAPALARLPVSTGPSVAETTSPEEDPGVADEARDAAGPADDPLPEEAPSEQEPRQETAPVAPAVPVTRTGNPRLMAKLAAVTGQTRTR